jgi:hypothetical protein
MTCNEHHTVKGTHGSHRHLDATGIGAIACARHGCFVPTSIVDVQKGDRQMNMDFTLCKALNQMNGTNLQGGSSL